ncbi:putative MO25-like protein At5g47540 [Apium graveolens]|uniref:putative MO25-like protein At5g47540 n=1 Tax=Apium graveolens TaxID=4045 RepID=UPI003D7B5E46
MKGLFKSSSKIRAPSELVSYLRDLLVVTDQSATTPTRNTKKMCEVKKVILEMRTILYGSDQSEPTTEACAKLTEEFFKGDTMHLLIIGLPKLDAGDRQEATYVLANLQRQRVNSRVVASDYLEKNLGLIDILVPGYEDDEIALCYGAILRDSTRHQVVTRYVLESEHFKKFFGYVQNPNFEIASDATATFKELLTRHKSTVAEFLSKNYEWFFREYNSLLESSNYITRRNAVKFLGLMLLDRSNTSVMVQYVSSIDNMRILMNLLRDSNKTIKLEAFHVFKLFAANQNKPPEIVNVLVTNRSKLLRFFNDFHFDKEEEDFKSDKAQVVREIETLEPTSPSSSPRRCEILC